MIIILMVIWCTLLLVVACEKISETALYINTHIKNYDNTQRMLEIQKRLSSSDKTISIMEPGRVFIKEGPLKKVYQSLIVTCGALCMCFQNECV